MKTAILVVGSLLAADLLFLSYVVFTHSPGSYEISFRAIGYGLICGLPLLGSFITQLAIRRASLRRGGS